MSASRRSARPRAVPNATGEHRLLATSPGGWLRAELAPVRAHPTTNGAARARIIDRAGPRATERARDARSAARRPRERPRRGEQSADGSAARPRRPPRDRLAGGVELDAQDAGEVQVVAEQREESLVDLPRRAGGQPESCARGERGGVEDDAPEAAGAGGGP